MSISKSDLARVHPIREQNSTNDITSFVGLETALRCDDDLKKFQINSPDQGIISLSKDDLTKFIISPLVWQNKEKTLQFLDEENRFSVIPCLEENQSLEALPEQLSENQVIALPITLKNLKTLLYSADRFQRMWQKELCNKKLLQEKSKNITEVMSISRELNGEQDIKKLLRLILTKAREITKADAGTIYTIESPAEEIKEGSWIKFEFVQNDSRRDLQLSKFKIPATSNSIVGNAVIHNTDINIPDLYQLHEDASLNPFGVRHDKKWDRQNGYESHSMLCLPMYDISYRMIGLIQLINRKRDFTKPLLESKDFSENILPFGQDDIEYAKVIAQQGGIALENSRMRLAIQQLFDGFVVASVKSIEQRDPTTSGHSHRVAKLTVGLAEEVSKTKVGPYKEVTFNEEQILELYYASLLHDIGKLGVREKVLVKAKKLYPWEHDLLLERFNVIRACHEIEYLKKFINYLQVPNLFPMDFTPETLLEERNVKLKHIEECLDFVRKANEPTILEQGGFDRLKTIANYTFKDPLNKQRPYISPEELAALSVSRGSLTREEWSEMQSHVSHSFEFLRKIPWEGSLKNVPQIAAKHHEFLNGSGYPTGAMAEEIPLQSRMMTISDIFDALSAADRPYKKAVPIDKALEILDMEMNGGKLDPELLRIFKEKRVFDLVIEK